MYKIFYKQHENKQWHFILVAICYELKKFLQMFWTVYFSSFRPHQLADCSGNPAEASVQKALWRSCNVKPQPQLLNEPTVDSPKAKKSHTKQCSSSQKYAQDFFTNAFFLSSPIVHPLFLCTFHLARNNPLDKPQRIVALRENLGTPCIYWQ